MRIWLRLGLVFALLFQGVNTSWAMSAHMAAEQRVSQGQEMEMPCHKAAHHPTAKSQCCCKVACNCAHFCTGAAAVVAIQMAPSIEVPAGSEAIRAEGAEAAPPHSLSPLRPPIALL